MNFGALRGLNDPLSVYNEAIYTFYRTLKRWTMGTYWRGAGGTHGAQLGEPGWVRNIALPLDIE